MSIIVKKIHGDEYLYFQTYEGGKKKEEYVGRADIPGVWDQALALYSQYKVQEISEFRQRIHDEMSRRRLPRAAGPIVDQMNLDQASRFSSGMESLLQEAIPLRIFDADEIRTLNRAKRILRKAKRNAKEKSNDKPAT
ncbi:MAG: hypothetical protein ABSD49_13060 [Candidatus Bathyarchaeia archaeon]|jgi:hypothetical protein